MSGRNGMSLAVALLAVCLLAPAAWPDAVELKTGVKFFGEVVEETERSVTIQTKEGTMTFDRKQIRSIEKSRRDRPVPAGDAAKGGSGKTSGGGAPKGNDRPVAATASYEGLDVQGPLKDLVARVGPGGVPRAEFEVYAARFARQAGKPVNDLSPGERRMALEGAVEDEVIFQAALADGLLREEYIQWRITEEFRNNQTAGKIEPQSFTEEDLRRHYDANPDLYTEPGSVEFEMIEFPDQTGEEEVRATAARAKQDPASVTGWKRAGWIKKGDAATHAVSGLESILDLAVGEISAPLRNPMRDYLLCRVTARKEPRRMTFEEARGKARFNLIGETQNRLDSELKERLRGEDGLDDKERVFRAALRSGKQRDWGIRQRIINTYLARIGADPNLKAAKKREEVLPEMRARFPVEILLNE